MATEQPADAARFATVAAHAAKMGVTLRRLDDGRFMVARWGMAREFATLGEVESLLCVMEGHRG